MKRCPVCSKEFNGRSDKKFCCDECRTYYHNTKKRSSGNQKMAPDDIFTNTTATSGWEVIYYMVKE